MKEIIKIIIIIFIATGTNNKKQRLIVFPGCAGRHRQKFFHFNNLGNHMITK